MLLFSSHVIYFITGLKNKSSFVFHGKESEEWESEWNYKGNAKTSIIFLTNQFLKEKERKCLCIFHVLMEKKYDWGKTLTSLQLHSYWINNNIILDNEYID